MNGGQCYRPNVCVPSKFTCPSPNLQCDGVRKRDLGETITFRVGHEAGTPIMGFMLSEEET